LIYRILGGLSLLIGIIFLGVAFLALLPFLNNFNVTLLILAGVFFVLAWFFIVIGWQLANPPRPEPAGERESGNTLAGGGPQMAESGSSTAEPHVADALAQKSAAGGPVYGGTEPAEAEPVEGGPEVEDRHPVAHIQPEDTFIGLGEQDSTKVQPPPESEGGYHTERRPGRVPAGRRFRKAGAALPPKEEPDR